MFCIACGKPLVLYRAGTKEKREYNLKCDTYGKRGKTACPPRRIRDFELTRSVLDDLRRAAHFARIKERRPKILSVPGTSLRLPA